MAKKRQRICGSFQARLGVNICVGVLFISNVSVALGEVTREINVPEVELQVRGDAVWFRNRVPVATQFWRQNGTENFCYIHPMGTKKLALVVKFRGPRILSIFSGPALEGLSFGLDDFSGDGIIDTIQLTDRTNGRLLEAMIIIHGIVEPLPDRFFKPDQTEFFEDEAIGAFIREKSRVHTLFENGR